MVDDRTMSKGEFAAFINVTPARISQYLTAGILDDTALSGTGRFARIRVATAIRQISERRHIGQALGNGMKTRLPDMLPELDEANLIADLPPNPTESSVATLIQLERLEQERRKNRLAQIDEAERLKRLVRVDDLTREVARAVDAAVSIFTGMVPDIGNAMAAKFGVPQRDAIHLVRQVMNEKRAAAARRIGTEAADMPEHVSLSLRLSTS